MVNTTVALTQYDAKVVALADGGWAVIWVSENGQNDFTGIYLQRYSALGNPVGSETRIHTSENLRHVNPDVSLRDDGTLLIAWQNPFILNETPFRTGSEFEIVQTIVAFDTIVTRGDDFIIYGSDNDEIAFGRGGDTVSGGAGTDTIVFDLDSTLTRTEVGYHQDTIIAAGESVVVHDVEWFQFWDVTLSLAEVKALEEVGTQGSSSAELLEGTSQADIVYADGGNDTINGLDGDDSLFGDNGDDEIDAGSDDDAVFGGAGNDSLDGGAGADTLTGGEGDDTYVVDSRNDLVIEVAGEGDDVIIATTDVFLRPHLERVVLMGEESDDLRVLGNSQSNTIHGDNGNNRLDGRFGANTLDAASNPMIEGTMPGNDTLIDRDGGDTMIGGNGDDVYRVSGDTFGAVTIVEQENGGDDFLLSSQTITVAENIETVRLLTADDIDVTGNAQNNEINGNNGANAIMGLGGDDTLRGVAGADTIDGGAGNDNLRGGNGNDVLNGDGDNDVMRGDAGADTLDGGDGVDRLFGGTGNDALLGGSGSDFFVFNGDFASDRILDFNNTTENDRLQFTGYEALNGGVTLEFDDFLITQVGTRARIQLDLDRDGLADVIDLDGDGDTDTARVDLFDFVATDLDATDFIL